MLWIAFFNVSIPAAFYYFLGYSATNASTERKMALEYLSYMHAGVWGPLILLAIAPGAIPAAYIEFISSNLNPVAYVTSLFILGELWYAEKSATAKWLFWSYLAYFEFMHFQETKRGTFAMYYLNPRLMHLDAKLYPSLNYALGWREHRFRYYYYFPDTAPAFDV